jgi:hypothetical protein
MDQSGAVLHCVNCHEPMAIPTAGLKTEIVAYSDGLREIINTVDGREVHTCSFVAYPMISDSSD